MSHWSQRLFQVALVASAFSWLGAVRASDLDLSAIKITLPKEVKWVESKSGSAQAILYGDPSQEGL